MLATELALIEPQPAQVPFLASPADICIFGGAAGPGKTWALLADPFNYVGHPDFEAPIFRRLHRQFFDAGGLHKAARKMYEPFGARFVKAEWRWPNGSKIQYAHMQHEEDVEQWRSAELPWVGFDQLEQFTKYQFEYIQSRMRTDLPMKPTIKGTCNPQPGWLAELLQWWWDPDTGYAIPERGGSIRWAVRPENDLVWADDPRDLEGHVDNDGFPLIPLSYQFIPAKIDDNRYVDPAYRGHLQGMSLIERERLLHGNWLIAPGAGKVFHKDWIRMGPPGDPDWRRVRYWDKAATPGGGAWSVGVLMCLCPDGSVVVEDVVRGQWSPKERNEIMQETAELDGFAVTVVSEQEGGSGGKESALVTADLLPGYAVWPDRPTGPKWERWKHLSATAEHGKLFVVSDRDLPPEDRWRRSFVNELHNADPSGPGAVDQVDAAAGAFIWLTQKGRPTTMH